MGPGGSDAAGQLADAAQLLDRLASAMPDATLFAFDADLRVVAARSPRAEAGAAGITQQLVGDMIATGSWARVREHYEATLAGERRVFDYALRETQSVHRVHFSPLAGSDGGVDGVLAVTHEIADVDEERQEIERRLRHQSALADVAMRALAADDPAELLRFACERAADGAGHAVALLEPEADGRLRLTASSGLSEELRERLPAAGELDGNLVDDRRCLVLPLDATARPGSLVVVCRDDRPPDPEDARFLTAVAGILAAARDRQRLEGELRQAALHDELTGLANRTALRDHLRLGLARNQRYDTRLAVFFLDLDGFKAVNDEHGHGIGDSVLREVATRLQRALRRADLVARFGGDEFVVLCETIAGRHEVDQVVARIRDAFAEPFAFDGHAARLGVSVGVAVVGRETTDPDAALDLADAEMYRAKRAAR
jgi:diguanylate cyclase (GGDEF)-like protein